MELVKGEFWTTATVGELIKELSKFDPNALVTTEGCDCHGNVVKVIVDEEGIVLIKRDDSL